MTDLGVLNGVKPAFGRVKTLDDVLLTPSTETGITAVIGPRGPGKGETLSGTVVLTNTTLFLSVLLVPNPLYFGDQIYHYLAVIVMLIVTGTVWLITRFRSGSALRAIRHGEEASKPWETRVPALNVVLSGDVMGGFILRSVVTQVNLRSASLAAIGAPGLQRDSDADDLERPGGGPWTVRPRDNTGLLNARGCRLRRGIAVDAAHSEGLPPDATREAAPDERL